MFFDKYLSEDKCKMLFDIYENWYLEEFEEQNFVEVYNVFKKYDFYFIEDIVLNYLDLFCMDKRDVEEGILELEIELGENFIYIIGNNMRYLEKIYNYIDI